MQIRLWHATVAGGLVGLVLGIGLEIGRQIQYQRQLERLTEEFNGLPPSMVNLLRPHAIPVGVCVLFALIGSLTYVFWSLRK